MKILPNVHKNLFPLGNFKNIKDYFEYFIFEKNIMDLDTLLHQSAERNEWLKFYPTLDGFPITCSYIEDENSVSLSDVSKELSEINLFLPKDEILFHSGKLPNGIVLTEGQEFYLKEIFSTSLDPYIANVHDGNDDTFWFIQIKDDGIRCFPVPDEFNEYEIIILDSPKAQIVDIKQKKRNPNWNGNQLYNNEMKTIIYIDLYKS